MVKRLILLLKNWGLISHIGLKLLVFQAAYRLDGRSLSKFVLFEIIRNLFSYVLIVLILIILSLFPLFMAVLIGLNESFFGMT